MLMFKYEACAMSANLYQRRSNKEPHIHAKKDPGLINSQFIVNGKMETCHISNNLQSTL